MICIQNFGIHKWSTHQSLAFTITHYLCRCLCWLNSRETRPRSLIGVPPAYSTKRTSSLNWHPHQQWSPHHSHLNVLINTRFQFSDKHCDGLIVLQIHLVYSACMFECKMCNRQFFCHVSWAIKILISFQLTKQFLFNV